MSTSMKLIGLIVFVGVIAVSAIILFGDRTPTKDGLIKDIETVDFSDDKEVESLKGKYEELELTEKEEAEVLGVFFAHHIYKEAITEVDGWGCEDYIGELEWDMLFYNLTVEIVEAAALEQGIDTTEGKAEFTKAYNEWLKRCE